MECRGRRKLRDEDKSGHALELTALEHTGLVQSVSMTAIVQNLANALWLSQQQA